MKNALGGCRAEHEEFSSKKISVDFEESYLERSVSFLEKIYPLAFVKIGYIMDTLKT